MFFSGVICFRKITTTTQNNLSKDIDLIKKTLKEDAK